MVQTYTILYDLHPTKPAACLTVKCYSTQKGAIWIGIGWRVSPRYCVLAYCSSNTKPDPTTHSICFQAPQSVRRLQFPYWNTCTAKLVPVFFCETDLENGKDIQLYMQYYYWYLKATYGYRGWSRVDTLEKNNTAKEIGRAPGGCLLSHRKPQSLGGVNCIRHCFDAKDVHT